VNTLPPDLLDRVARAIHDRFRAGQEGILPAADASMRDWSDLDDSLKASNRHQAADILPKLRAIGCDVLASADDPEPFVFSAEEVERLAEREHLRWVNDRVANGWTPGPVRDGALRRTPYLVPYAELPEAVRELDRDAVRAIPGLLRGVGLAIRRSHNPA
jgi:hypothetical protein